MTFRDRFRRKRVTSAGTITTHYRVGRSYPTYNPDYPTSNVDTIPANSRDLMASSPGSDDAEGS